MKTIKTLIAMTIVTSITGCAGITVTMDSLMSSWKGSHIDDAITQWGYPHQARNIKGRKWLSWENKKIVSVLEGLPSSASVPHTHKTLRGHCQRILEIDQGGNIINGTWSGNNCPVSFEIKEYSHWRKKGITK